MYLVFRSHSIEQLTFGPEFAPTCTRNSLTRTFPWMRCLNDIRHIENDVVAANGIDIPKEIANDFWSLDINLGARIYIYHITRDA